MWSLLASLQAELRAMRRLLLPLAILFFTVMLIEIDLGHRAALARQEAWLALVPVVWLPVALIALIAVEVVPSKFTAIVAMLVMGVAAVVGVVGSAAHMTASGVNLDNLARVFSSAVWGGPASPNWPISIALAAALGFAGAIGAERNDSLMQRDLGGVITAVAFALIVSGCGLAAWPAAVMASAACLAIGSLLLLAALIAMLATAATERSLP